VRKAAWRWPLYAAMAALLLLHNDLWWWNDATLVLGLPVGLTYHVVLCGAASLVFLLITRKAWPEDLE
jgi:Protein of unknown function (DUF3311)